MIGRHAFLAAMACAVVASPLQGATPDPSPARFYATVDPMNRTISTRLIPQVEALLERLLREKRAMRLDGVAVFESGDKFLPGKIAIGLSYPLLAMDRSDPRFAHLLAGYREIADLTVGDDNETWGIYYYLSALYQLQRAGLLEQAISPATLARLRRQLDWRNFVDVRTWRLIDLPNNYYGVAFSVARLRLLLGWEDETASAQLLARMLDHYRTYSGPYGFADETDGNGRFDRYSVLLIAEIAHRFTETGMTPTPEVRGWLRRSARLVLLRANMAGTGWEYGRSIGAYGETAALEILAAAADLGLLTARERDMAYAYSSRVAARYADFWLDPDTGSVNMWSRGRRTDAYRDTHRILGENLSLARQYIYTNAIWNRLGYRDRAPRADYGRWLDSLPHASFLYFARGAHDRALLTIRDRGHVIGLPLINGAAGQHMHNPYFPIPFAAGLLQGSADASFPQLVPRITLADGSVLMPLAWFRDVRMERQGVRTIVTWRMDAMDRMGGNDAVQDRRVTVETRYVFSRGRIERTDRFTAPPATGIASIDLEFATFSSAPEAQAGAIRFRAGDVTRFAWRGLGTCAPRAVSGSPYQAPDRAFATVIACRANGVRFDRPVETGWALDYR
jgi:hypothetical protein